MVVWSIAPKLNKPKIMEVGDIDQGSVIFWNVQSTSGGEVSGLLSVVKELRKDKIENIE